MPPYTCKTPGCKVTATSALALSKHKCKGRVAAIAALAERRQLEADRYARKRARLNEQGDYVESGPVRVHCTGLLLTDLHAYNQPFEDTQSAQEHARTAPSPLPAPTPPRFPSPPLVPVPPPVSTRSGRSVRFPAGKYEDFIPSGASTVLSQWGAALPEPMRTPTPSPSPSPAASQSSNNTQDWFTREDAFGLFRRFSRLPQHDPETGFTLESVSDAPNHDKPTENARARNENIAWLTQAIKTTPIVDSPRKLGPFGDSVTQFRLTDWFYGRGSSVLSNQRYDDLLAILRSKGFTVADLEGFSAKKADRLLEQWLNTKDLFVPEHGWYETSVSMPVPKTRISHASEAAAPQITIHGVVHRRLRDLITGVASDSNSRFARDYHWLPSRLYWNPPSAQGCVAFVSSSPLPSSLGSPSPVPSQAASDSFPEPYTPPSHNTDESSRESTPSPVPPSGPPPPLRVLTDCYNSDAMLEEDENIHNMPRAEGDADDVEYAVLPLLLWSDETCLSQFGNAKLWPIYLYFGNLSKYVRGRPTEFAAHHLAYIPSVREPSVFVMRTLLTCSYPQLPDDIKDAYEKVYGSMPTADTLKFCKRELFCRIWLMLLDEDFMAAYRDGILLKCGDGILRRLFPRFFTYSADYPEKYVAAYLSLRCSLTDNVAGSLSPR